MEKKKTETNDPRTYDYGDPDKEGALKFFPKIGPHEKKNERLSFAGPADFETVAGQHTNTRVRRAA